MNANKWLAVGLLGAGGGLLLLTLALWQSGEAPPPRASISRGQETPIGGGFEFDNGHNIPRGAGSGCDLASVYDGAKILTGPPVGGSTGRRQPFQNFVLACAPGQPPQVEPLGLLDYIAQGKQPILNAESAAVVVLYLTTALERGLDTTYWFGKPISSPLLKDGYYRAWYEKAVFRWPKDAASGEQVSLEPLGCRQVPACFASLKPHTEGKPRVNGWLAGGALLLVAAGAAVFSRSRRGYSLGWAD